MLARAVPPPPAPSSPPVFQKASAQDYRERGPARGPALRRRLSKMAARCGPPPLIADQFHLLLPGRKACPSREMLQPDRSSRACEREPHSRRRARNPAARPESLDIQFPDPGGHRRRISSGSPSQAVCRAHVRQSEKGRAGKGGGIGSGHGAPPLPSPRRNAPLQHQGRRGWAAAVAAWRIPKGTAESAWRCRFQHLGARAASSLKGIIAPSGGCVRTRRPCAIAVAAHEDRRAGEAIIRQRKNGGDWRPAMRRSPRQFPAANVSRTRVPVTRALPVLSTVIGDHRRMRPAPPAIVHARPSFRPALVPWGEDHVLRQTRNSHLPVARAAVDIAPAAPPPGQKKWPTGGLEGSPPTRKRARRARVDRAGIDPSGRELAEGEGNRPPPPRPPSPSCPRGADWPAPPARSPPKRAFIPRHAPGSEITQMHARPAPPPGDDLGNGQRPRPAPFRSPRPINYRERITAMPASCAVSAERFEQTRQAALIVRRRGAHAVRRRGRQRQNACATAYTRAAGSAQASISGGGEVDLGRPVPPVFPSMGYSRSVALALEHGRANGQILPVERRASRAPSSPFTLARRPRRAQAPRAFGRGMLKRGALSGVEETPRQSFAGRFLFGLLLSPGLMSLIVSGIAHPAPPARWALGAGFPRWPG